MNLKLRLKKRGSEHFVDYPLDEDEYSLNELQELINFGIDHKTLLTLSVSQPKKKFVKFNPVDEMSSISVLFEC